jgi:hypothetical protein
MPMCVLALLTVHAGNTACLPINMRQPQRSITQNSRTLGQLLQIPAKFRNVWAAQFIGSYAKFHNPRTTPHGGYVKFNSSIS